MGLGTGKSHVIGRNQQFYVMPESTHGTPVKPTAASAIKTEQSDFSEEEPSEPIVDNSSYRYDLETIQDKRKHSWSWDGYLIPSGTAATEPDCGPFLTAGLGADNSGSGSEWIYTVSSSQDWPTISLTRLYNSIWMELLYRAWVDKIVIKIAGGQQPRLHVEGRAGGYALTGPSTLNGNMVGAVATVQSADQCLYMVHSVVQVGSNDNSGAGWEVDSKSGAALTLEGSAGGSDTEAVIPFAPTPTMTGSPISGLLGSLSIDSTEIRIQSCEITLENNHEAFEDEAFVQDVEDFTPGVAKVSVSMGFRMRQDFLKYLANPRAFTTNDIAVQTGTTSGERFKFDIDYGEAIVPKVAIPSDHKSGIATLEYQGLGSGANGPLIITHD